MSGFAVPIVMVDPTKNTFIIFLADQAYYIFVLFYWIDFVLILVD